MMCSAVVALMAVAADYNSLGRDVVKGKLPPGAEHAGFMHARSMQAVLRALCPC
jgi:hypothetical protein